MEVQRRYDARLHLIMKLRFYFSPKLPQGNISCQLQIYAAAGTKNLETQPPTATTLTRNLSKKPQIKDDLWHIVTKFCSNLTYGK